MSTSVLDEGCGIDVIYLEYRKAFDTVPHTRLMLKLMKLGVPEDIFTMDPQLYNRSENDGWFQWKTSLLVFAKVPSWGLCCFYCLSTVYQTGLDER